MIAYAETSAVLNWLLGEPREVEVRHVLADAERVVSSSLTAVECARVMARATALEQIGRTDELAALQLLDSTVAGWAVLAMTGQVLARARARFPVEPVRTFDAIHLSTAAAFGAALGSITVVTLDDRIRANASALGFATAP